MLDDCDLCEYMARLMDTATLHAFRCTCHRMHRLLRAEFDRAVERDMQDALTELNAALPIRVDVVAKGVVEECPDVPRYQPGDVPCMEPLVSSVHVYGMTAVLDGSFDRGIVDSLFDDDVAVLRVQRIRGIQLTNCAVFVQHQPGGRFYGTRVTVTGRVLTHSSFPLILHGVLDTSDPLFGSEDMPCFHVRTWLTWFAVDVE